MAKASARDVCAQVSLLSMLDPSTLKQCGKDRYKTRCMFHADSTPSMVVNLNRGRWLFCCFGCGVNGSVIDFVMLRDNVDFKTALGSLSSGVACRFSAPPERPAWRVLKCVTGCGRTLRVDRVESLAYAYQKGWQVSDDMLGVCGHCNSGGTI